MQSSSTGVSRVMDTPQLAAAYKALSAGLDERADQPRGVSTIFAGARGAVVALSGCTMMIGIFLLIYLRGFARVDANLTMLAVIATIALLLLPRLVRAMGWANKSIGRDR